TTLKSCLAAVFSDPHFAFSAPAHPSPPQAAKNNSVVKLNPISPFIRLLFLPFSLHRKNSSIFNF
ncbi:hypothetical protein, partial [Enterococcus faecalis]|uniref:hypothetical protein n=1 Tax=Enterococcus faecalis TaxID=1351 RepID=UPI003CC56B8E